MFLTFSLITGQLWLRPPDVGFVVIPAKGPLLPHLAWQSRKTAKNKCKLTSLNLS